MQGSPDASSGAIFPHIITPKYNRISKETGSRPNSCGNLDSASHDQKTRPGNLDAVGDIPKSFTDIYSGCGPLTDQMSTSNFMASRRPTNLPQLMVDI